MTSLPGKVLKEGQRGLKRAVSFIAGADEPNKAKAATPVGPNAREKSTNVSRTAKPLEQVSDKGRKRRRRRAFAATKGFGAPQLGIPGLTEL